MTTTDPLTPAVSRILWPFLQSAGFKKVTNRKFARDRGDVVQQIWLDANGIAGRKKLQVTACANFVFGGIDGYMDPHGFKCCNGRSWNATKPEAATIAMEQVVAALRDHEMPVLDRLSNVDAMLAARWRHQDLELLRIADGNRRLLKL